MFVLFIYASINISRHTYIVYTPADNIRRLHDSSNDKIKQSVHNLLGTHVTERRGEGIALHIGQFPYNFQTSLMECACLTRDSSRAYIGPISISHRQEIL